MIVTIVNQLLMDVGCLVADASMVIIHVAAVDVITATGIGGRDGRAVLKDMKSAIIIHDGVAGTTGETANGCDRHPDGIQGNVGVTVVTAQPTDKISNVKVQEKENRCSIP